MFVYIIRSGKTGPYKIGFSNNVELRLMELQVGNPNQLYLVAKFEFNSRRQAMAVERRLHKMFGKQRIRGEWFSPRIQLSRADAYFKTDFHCQKRVLTESEVSEQVELRILSGCPI